MSKIHPQAIVDPAAELAADVEVGPFSIIGPDVRIGAGTRVDAHAIIRGPASLGRNNVVHPFCVLGGDPQDKKYAGEATGLEIGDGNVFREYVTVNRGTVQDAGVTRIGNDNWIMAYVHIAHDCQVGDHTIFANAASLAGHVTVEDYAILGGFCNIHQFCRIGAHSFLGMASVVVQDLPPYVMAAGDKAAPHGVNVEGLKRRGFSREAISAIRQAYKLLYRSGLRLEEARERICELAASTPELARLCEFLNHVDRGILR